LFEKGPVKFMNDSVLEDLYWILYRCTFLLERKVPKETAFLPADDIGLYIVYTEQMSQQPIPCYPAIAG
jgi:hypothetical protein